MKWGINTLALGSLLLSVPIASSAAAQTSSLWGHAGEAWDPLGRLPDYSYAGYRAGEAPLPNVAAVVNVLDFGAVGDGVVDDLRAFEDAVAFVAGAGGGAIDVPAGRYRLNGLLNIDRSNVVLRGVGTGATGTTLAFTTGLQALTGKSSPWINGQGGLLWVGQRGGLGFVAGLGSQLTTVTSPALRGDTELVVGNAGGIRAGDTVVLEMTDPDDSLGLHKHNDQAAPGTCSWQPQPTRWVVEVEQVSGNLVSLAQPLRLDVRPAWSPKLRRYDPVREVGIEHLTLEMPAHAYPGHLQEPGFNALTFEGAQDCWARDIEVVNADNGPCFTELTKHCTVQDVRFRVGFAGHHGLSFNSGAADNLIDGFTLDNVYIHGITVDHGPNGNVVRRGTGKNLSLDHHRDASFENLFTNLDVGFGSQVWVSGGSSCAGPHAGARHTYWNLRSSGWSAPPDPSWVQIQQNVVPARTTVRTVNNAWTEALPAVTPEDLYASQLERRLTQEVLTVSEHRVATFEDGTLGFLGQEEGSPPQLQQGALTAVEPGEMRFVDPSARHDDQDVLWHLLAGVQSGARVGVLLRAPTPASSVDSGQRVTLEAMGPLGQAADRVRLVFEDATGIRVEGTEVAIDPAAPFAVRLALVGDRIEGWGAGAPALDHSGVEDPAGGGYTSLYLDLGPGAPGSLALEQVQVMDHGTKAELHVDAGGIAWVTIYQPGLFVGGFDAAGFVLSIDAVPYNFPQVVTLLWSQYVVGVESVSDDHATFGLDLQLEEGTLLRVDYGETDEAFLPWW